MFPDHLSHEERSVAKKEFDAIPEFFYTTFSWLPVIRPDNYMNFLKHLRAALGAYPQDVFLWS